MLQAVLAYGFVALAGAWVVWSMALPRKWKAALRGRVKLRRR